MPPISHNIKSTDRWSKYLEKKSAQRSNPASQFPTSKSNQASVGTNPNQGGPTSQTTWLKGSATSALMPDNTGHPRDLMFYALMSQSRVQQWWIQSDLFQCIIKKCLIRLWSRELGGFTWSVRAGAACQVTSTSQDLRFPSRTLQRLDDQFDWLHLSVILMLWRMIVYYLLYLCYLLCCT